MKKPRPRHLRSRRAFTLIELLTVIAIIGILAAILIPVVGRVREGARQTQCRSNIRQIAMATSVAAQDNKGRFPAMRSTYWDKPDTTVNGVRLTYPYLLEQSTQATLRPYFKTNGRYEEPFRCPTVDGRGPTTGKASWFGPGIDQSQYRYNFDGAANSRMALNPAKAVLFYEMLFDDWSAADWPHTAGGASMSVAYADGHVARMTYVDYQELIKTSKFYTFGWTQ
jgi:prepilin-type N-terminal cleavage/methylation domain-containing protein/prepilin-type processing-associated H-X9-DG protein